MSVEVDLSEPYGTRQEVEGEFQVGERVLVIDGVITSGSAKIEAVAPLKEGGLLVEDVLVVVDREDCGRAVLAEAE
jgi:orotate phosphoribosyltransferase